MIWILIMYFRLLDRPIPEQILSTVKHPNEVRFPNSMHNDIINLIHQVDTDRPLEEIEAERAQENMQGWIFRRYANKTAIFLQY